MTLEFKNLPLIEVAARFVLADSRLLPMSIPFLVDLHQQLHDRFPEVTDLPAFEQTFGGSGFISFSPGIQPAGARFVDSKNGVALHIQANQIVCRWLKGSNLGDDGTEYPRFHSGLKPALSAAVSGVNALMGEGYVTPSIVNLTYSNFIAPGPKVRYADVARYVTFFGSPAMEADDEIHNYEVSFRRNGEIDLKMSVQAILTDNEGGRGGVLVTGAGMFVPESGADGFEELDRVHAALIALFKDHLTEGAKAEWGMI